MAEVWALVYLLCCVLRQDTGYANLTCQHLTEASCYQII